MSASRIFPNLVLLFCTISVVAQRQQNVIEVNNVNGRYIMQIDRSVLNKDILILGRVINSRGIQLSDLKGSGNRGGKFVENIIRFELNDNMVTVRLQDYPSNSHSYGYAAIDKKIVSSLNVKVDNDKLENKIVFDITRFLVEDNEIFWTTKNLQQFVIGDSIANETKLMYSRAYADRLEMGIIKNYTSDKSVFINLSLMLLPGQIMPARLSSQFINYFEQPLKKDESSNASAKGAILRWRLKPSMKDRKLFLKGKLVQPEKPIVFYMDTSIPARWKPYVKQGVLDWNKSFEKIGFRNAVVVKEPGKASGLKPYEEFSSSFSTIFWINSYIEDGTYSLVVDPRSGEILQCPVIISKAIEKFFRRYYFARAALIDSRSRIAEFDEKLMGGLLQRLITHEVGHSLGFDHNHFASDCVPIEKYRDPKWMDQHGLAPSVMDYAKVNHIAQPGDGIHSDKALFYSIGAFDEWAINMGYYDSSAMYNYGGSDKIEDVPGFVKMHCPQLYLKLDEDDARMVTEALGDDHVKASEYGMKNLKVLFELFPQWIEKYGYDSAEIALRLEGMINQYNSLLQHVIADIGGRHFNVDGNGKLTTTYTNTNTVKKSLHFVKQYFFDMPSWVNVQPVIDKYKLSIIDPIPGLRNNIMYGLLSNVKVGEIIANPDTSQTSLIFNALRSGVFSYKGVHLSEEKKLLQKQYIESLKGVKEFYPNDERLLRFIDAELELVRK